MSELLIQVKDLDAWIGDQKVLDRVNLSVKDKKILAVIGPRGSGKSTLLRCMNRLFEDGVNCRVEGVIQLGEDNILGPDVSLSELRRRLCMVFSEPRIFEHLSLFENVALGLRLKGETAGAVVGEAVERALVTVGLWGKYRKSLDKPIHHFSQGEKQFICLARALVLRPDVLLLDEVTNSVGLQNTMIFEKLIKDISQKVTIIFTTSSRKQAARISDRTAFLLDGELIEVGKTSELFMNPKDERTEDFLTGRFG